MENSMEYWYSQLNTVGYEPYKPATEVAEAIAEAKANTEG